MLDGTLKREGYMPASADRDSKQALKMLNIIFLVDISGSMRKEDDGKTSRIDAVNETFVQMIPALRQCQIECQDKYELRISIITFDQYARSVVDSVPIMEYQHENIECTEWVTYYSNALEELNKQLTNDNYMRHAGMKLAAPYIMLMTDGEPSEEDDYHPVLEELNKNGYFHHANRFAVLMGSEAVNSTKAHDAVVGFVKDAQEGIIDAVDATVIASEVQAVTMHTIKAQTQHGRDFEEDDEDDKSQNSGGFYGTADDEDDDFDDIPFPDDDDLIFQ